MNLSVDILRRELEQRQRFTVFGAESGLCFLEKVLFLGAGETARKGQIYIGEAATMPSPPAERLEAVLLLIGGETAPWEEAFEAVFHFAETISPFALHNAVQRIFARYETWSADLRHILGAGSDVQAMIDASTAIFGNPLLLQDSNFTTIAISEQYAANPSLAPIIDNKSIPYLMRADHFGNRLPETNSAVVSLQITGRRALYVNLYQQGRFQYRLMALELTGAFYPSTTALLEFLSNYIQLAIGFVVDEAKESTTLSYVLKNILSGEYTDRQYIAQRLREFGWDSAHSCVCAKVYVDLPDFRNRTLHYMCERLKTIFEEAGVFEYENSIVVLFNLSDFEGEIKKVEGVLGGFLQDNNMKAGLSNPFTGFADLPRYFIQAAAALDLGPRSNPDVWIHRFREVTEAFILESCTEKLPAHMICAPGLLKLREYDREHNTELYQTLFVYLKNNLRAVHAAKELFIHRSTFLYRLERIRKITGLALENDDDQWYLLLSFKLLGHPCQSESRS